MGQRVIVALSGGKASAWCADWAFKNYSKQDIILYFNDTKWEHADLYRFLKDLEEYFQHPITHDSDGRTPEDLFYANNALANDRMPFCSRILKAERLQKFYKAGDILIFGISLDELYRAKRLAGVYQTIAIKNDKWPKLIFPLIDEKITRAEIDGFVLETGIKDPELYRLGFTHNNCSGGCVRAGKKQWKLLFETFPDVYLDRERVEETMRKRTGKDIHFFKDETLRAFRGRIERKELTRFYNVSAGEQIDFECIGICGALA